MIPQNCIPIIYKTGSILATVAFIPETPESTSLSNIAVTGCLLFIVLTVYCYALLQITPSNETSAANFDS